ncbi:unnamed protein product, partial [Cylindrotheca closterium]
MPRSTADEIKAQERASHQMLRSSVVGGEQAQSASSMPGAYQQSSTAGFVTSKDTAREAVVSKYVFDGPSSEDDDASVSGHGDYPTQPMPSLSYESMNLDGKVRRESSAQKPGSIRVSGGTNQADAKAARASANADRARGRSRSFDSTEHDGLAKDIPNTRRVSSNETYKAISSSNKRSEVRENFGAPAAPLQLSCSTYSGSGNSPEDDPSSPSTIQQPNANNERRDSGDGSQISAQLIDEMQEQERLKNTLNNVLQQQSAVQVVDVAAEDRLKRKRQRRNFCLYTLLAVALLGGVVAAVVITSQDNNVTLPPTISPSISPTMAPTTRESAVIEAVIDQFGDLPEDENTPQYRAIQWLTDMDTTIEFPLDSEEAEYTMLERYVAVVFAYTTQYWYWVNNDNWLNPDLPVCEWFGLTCNDDGRIGVLDLAAQNLDGPIPSEIGYLDNLDFVFLFRNKLSGPIPSEVGKLGDVDFMYLNENLLTGHIPDELSGLLDADELFLFGNQLNGTIPAAFGGLVDLVNLYMHDNRLSGEIPSSLSQLKRLQRLYLQDNNIQGQIPSELGGIISLQRIQLHNNRLT